MMSIVLEILLVLIIAIVWHAKSGEEEKQPTVVSGDAVEIHVIDVGQGDSTLIKTKDGNILIDAGPGDHEDELVSYLSSVDVTSFKYCIFTHPHEDHIGGADLIIEGFDVENVIMSHAVTSTVTFERLLGALEESEADVFEANAGDVYKVGEVSVRILAPINKTDDRDLNNSSVIASVEYGEVNMIFTGDAEEIEERDILESPYRKYLDADFLKTGHHGSSTSSCDEFLDAVTPRIASISCGEGNSYGHPHAETLDKFSDRGIRSYRTDELGSIVFLCDGKTIEINE